MKLFSKPAESPFPLRQKAEALAAMVPDLSSRMSYPAFSTSRGRHGLRRAGTGEEFWQFRKYEPHNAPAEIDWRQSAKTDDIFIRQKEWQSRQTLLLWCAGGPAMDFRSQKRLPSKAEFSKILALALAIVWDRLGEKAKWLQDDLNTPGTQISQLENILLDQKQLSSLPIGSGKIPHNSVAVLTGDFLEPLATIKNALETIAAQTRGGLLIQILDPLEIDLPCKGRVLFQDPAHGAQELVNNVDSIRPAYMQRIEQHRKDIAALCRSFGWDYVFHSTDDDLQTSLLTLWEIIHGGGPHE